MKSIIGKKLGMTSIFDNNGKQTAVTIIEAGPCVVIQKKTVETDGYNALQIAFGDLKEKHTLLSEKNHFAKANTPAKKHVKEIRDSESDKNVGDSITVGIFAEGDKVVTRLTSIGKHEGDLPGAPRTGNVLKMTSITIHRIANGKLAEKWSEKDMIALLTQLGVMKPPDKR